ncbi:hypothetical protein [Lactobacillus xylocopicola]|uniref:ABC transporter permease n=1 Tax=Lactobacillus xylocopicola TaxID=2976676 RepID=A0ABM8BIW5_9LACO|nr:hypothetical protein [Lactobacillus xylocopicola]BDR61255.1 hypothetical protein KIM322_15160 [Lactobacillus xylocopicola]
MNFQNKKIKLLTLFLVACQSILLTLLAAFFIGKNYNHTISTYPNVKKETIYLKDLKNKQRSDILSFFAEEADKNKLVIVRTEQPVSQNGASKDVKIGVLGDINKHPLPLFFAGRKIVSSALLNKLLQSSDSVTIGNALNYRSIAETPNFASGQNLVLFKLEDLVKQSGSINGTYQVIGLSSDQKVTFLTKLSSVTHKTKKQLQTTLGGKVEEQGLMPTIIIAGLVLNAVGLLILLLLTLLQSLTLLGDLVLLGWSKYYFLLKLFSPYIIAAFSMSIFVVPLGILISGNFLSLWSLFFIVNLANCIIVAVLSLLASLMITTMSFLDVLKHKFPRKSLLIFSILGYVILSVSIIFGSWALDGPLKTLNETYQMSQNWHKVSNLTIIKDSQFGNQNQSHQDALKSRSKDFYLWYKDIYQEKGVYLIGTTIYTPKVVEALSETDNSLPFNKPFLWLTVSPNYLKKLDIKISSNLLSEAEQGKRLYLLPPTFSPETKVKFKKWLQTNDTRSISPTDTPTVFNQKRQFLFKSYKSENTFFTWATKTDEPLQMKQTIILVATPANMTYFESDNLSAQGLNGLIKFDISKIPNKKKEKIFTNIRINKYHPTFDSIGNYIKGLQKDLSYTIYLFGGIGVVLLCLSLVLVYVILRIYQVSQQELFNVKKFLGFSIFDIYNKPLIFLLITFIAELLSTILIRSRAGTLVIIIKFITQMLFVLLYLCHSSIKQLLNNLREE